MFSLISGCVTLLFFFFKVQERFSHFSNFTVRKQHFKYTVCTFIQVYHSSLFEKYSKCFISNITYTKVTIANKCVKYTKEQS